MTRRVANMDRIAAEHSGNASRGLVRLGGVERLASAAALCGVLGVLGLASILEPDARGHGTHEQLGLLPCMSVQVLGIPCPFCGMTTSFTHFAHGNPVEAFLVQPAGAFLFVLMVCGGMACAAAALAGRWFPALTADSTVKKALLGVALIVGAAWLYKIAVFVL